MAPALASSPNLPTVGLSAGENAPNLRDFVRYKPIETPMPLSQVLDSMDEASLLEVSERTINFGAPDKPLLVLVKVRNDSAKTGTWIFSTDRGSLRYIEMFELTAQRTKLRLANSDLSTQQEMLKDYHAFAFQFSLQPGEERVLGVVFEAETSTKLPLSIMEPREHHSLIDFLFNIVLVASVATFTLILINAILFVVTGKSAFIYFVIAELALLFQAVHLSGYTTIFLFYEHAELARALSGIAKIVFALFSVRFIRSFLRTRQTWPRFERPAQLFEAVCWLTIVWLIVYPFVPFLTLRLASDVSIIIVFLALIGLPVIAVVAVKRYGWIYSPLVLGWSVWSIYLVYTILAVYTPLPEFAYQWRWMAPIGFFEALMLSIALGLDIRNTQQSEVRAQKSLSDALKNRLDLMHVASLANSNRAIAEQQLRETSSLVHSGGHDSRGFTGALKMYGHVIENSKDLHRTRKYGALVSELAEQLDTTLNTIMEGSSGDSAFLDSPVRIETINIKALLDTIKQIHQETASQSGMTIRCRTTVSEITGDRHLLIRLMSNLVSNALKYAQNGTILLSARSVAGDIRLEVWDQGPGIKPEQLQRLLSQEHLRERLNPEVEGTGSGLGICLELCDKVQAVLSARSKVGRGSVFRVEFCGVHAGGIDTHSDIAVLDDTTHWPDEVLRTLRDKGVRIRFITNLGKAQILSAGLVMLDPALHPTPPAQKLDCEIAICSYEFSSVNLGEWTEASSIALAKPVTAESVLHLIMLSSASGHKRRHSKVSTR